MKKFLTLLSIFLFIALLGSNAYWFYLGIDQAVTNKYKEQMVYEREEALKQALVLLPMVASCADSAEIINMAERTTALELYEKEGRTWIGWFGFSFNDEDKLIDIETSFPLTDQY